MIVYSFLMKRKHIMKFLHCFNNFRFGNVIIKVIVLITIILITNVEINTLIADQINHNLHNYQKDTNQFRQRSLSQKEPPQKLKLKPITPALKKTYISKSIRDAEEEYNYTEYSEKDLLLLAGKLVGNNNWKKAKQIYKYLIYKSNNTSVINAVKRNLKVVDQKLMIINETDYNKKRQLQLELMQTHEDLGHKKAARIIYNQIYK